MTKKSKPRSYDSNFIEEAVNLALTEEKPIKQIASDLGIPAETLYTWVAKAKAGKLNNGPKNRSQNNVGEANRKIAELEKQNRLLKMERDILKKAMAFFVETPK